MQLHWKQIHTAGTIGGGLRACAALAASLNAPFAGLGDPGGDEEKGSQQKMNSGCCVGGNSWMLVELWLCGGLRVQPCA